MPEKILSGKGKGTDFISTDDLDVLHKLDDDILLRLAVWTLLNGANFFISNKICDESFAEESENSFISGALRLKAEKGLKTEEIKIKMAGNIIKTALARLFLSF